jgi:uncharacterized protein YdaU (DUF1376 family)
MADTRHLTTIQHGAYLLLLMTAWRNPDCKLPNDDKHLARCVGMSLQQWLTHKRAITAFWYLDEQNRWGQRRLIDEKNYIEGRRNKNIMAGKASALKRNNRHSTDVQPNFNQTSTPTPTPTPRTIINNSFIGDDEKNSVGKKLSKKPTRLPEDWELPQEWGDWAADECGLSNPEIDMQRHKFKDYWLSTGKNPTKTNWKAAWRYWIRGYIERKMQNGVG